MVEVIGTFEKYCLCQGYKLNRPAERRADLAVNGWWDSQNTAQRTFPGHPTILSTKNSTYSIADRPA